MVSKAGAPLLLDALVSWFGSGYFGPATGGISAAIAIDGATA
jgi:hypothetical protein